jgi:hypothetical protein
MLWHYPLALRLTARREICLMLNAAVIASREFIRRCVEYAAFFGANASPITLMFYA